MNRIRITITEDQEAIRNSLMVLLDAAPQIELVEAFDDGEKSVLFLKRHPVDVALFDIQLPGISGIDAIATLKAVHPAMQFLVLSAFDDPDYIFRALRAGATGYILKNTGTDKLLESIRDLHGGGSPMSSQIARKVVTAFASFQPVVPQCEQLSRRENEILQLLSKGYRYKEIGAQLFISKETVRTHIRNIYEKLQVNSRMEALKKAGVF